MNSVADIWKIVLSRLSQDLSETTISTWFDEVEAVSIKDRTLYLHCPNDFKRSTIESMFSDRIKDSLRDIYSADFDVKLLSTAESTALFEPEVKKSTALLDSGEFTFDTFVVGESNKMAYAAARDIRVDIRQSNHEGVLIDEIQAADGVYDGIVINPGAYTHYSYAIYDALLAVSVPAVEVHLSNINRRESFRRISVTAPACRAQIVGHGFLGYMEAIDLLAGGGPLV